MLHLPLSLRSQDLTALLAKALQSMREAGDVEEAEDDDWEKVTDAYYSVDYQVNMMYICLAVYACFYNYTLSIYQSICLSIYLSIYM